ncbi:hypothetical protein JQ581_30115 [Bradyrhizobium liaoningense]|uniref:hypothetical protein n=1 Tax=Bradyrhizobium liaoningense TaxID=43992 RepID=UPI001BA77D1F|nr:hypothetical protein [Bradyrhizobium liaoningense]MBR0741196.1 hypothetical protein [Bradyrhizobium liaoningense]
MSGDGALWISSTVTGLAPEGFDGAADPPQSFRQDRIALDKVIFSHRLEIGLALQELDMSVDIHGVVPDQPQVMSDPTVVGIEV